MTTVVAGDLRVYVELPPATAVRRTGRVVVATGVGRRVRARALTVPQARRLIVLTEDAIVAAEAGAR